MILFPLFFPPVFTSPTSKRTGHGGMLSRPPNSLKPVGQKNANSKVWGNKLVLYHVLIIRIQRSLYLVFVDHRKDRSSKFNTNRDFLRPLRVRIADRRLIKKGKKEPKVLNSQGHSERFTDCSCFFFRCIVPFRLRKKLGKHSPKEKTIWHLRPQV